MMTELTVERRRGSAPESVHRISVAVVSHEGTLLARSGNPNLVTFWRSAAKPFQAMPLVEDGVLEEFALGQEELALVCASHSSETMHRSLTTRFLERIGCTEDDLACGPHRPLGEAVAREVVAQGITMTPIWSNCSGKHAGMLALARHHGWETTGYHRRGHPVQDRIIESVVSWTGVPEDRLIFGTDGCATVCFGLPLRDMALAFARFGASPSLEAKVVREAMMAHPAVVAGTGRSCTEIMQALPGRTVVKIGADGVYCATLIDEQMGVALKVEDGDMSVSPIALVEVLRQIFAASSTGGFPEGALAQYRRIPLTNTRDEEIGTIVPAGDLTFIAA